ncbi:hypothetical protein IAU59_001503 [Kwoniella sp. CBS 9459]
MYLPVLSKRICPLSVKRPQSTPASRTVTLDEMRNLNALWITLSNILLFSLLAEAQSSSVEASDSHAIVINREETKDARLNIHIPTDTRYTTSAGGAVQTIEGGEITQALFPEKNLKAAKDAGAKFQASAFTWEVFIPGTKETLWRMDCTANVEPNWTGTTEFKLTLNNTEEPWIYQEEKFKLEPETAHVECPKGECVFVKGCKGFEKPEWDFKLD